jgi:lipoprotein-releasing system permease protein
MPYELEIAVRYLAAKRKQAFISVISVIAMTGVAVGVMALMIALALSTGLQREIRARILGTTAHISIFTSQRGTFDDLGDVAARVRSIPHVMGAAPALYSMGLVQGDLRSQPVTIKAVDPQAERSVTDLLDQIHTGSAADLTVKDGELDPILLGHDLALKIGAAKGDVVTFVSPNGRLTPMGIIPSVRKLRVAGTVKSGLYEFDSGWAYVALQSAPHLFDPGAAESLVEVKIDNIYAVKEVAKTLVAALGDDFLTSDWIEQNQSLFAALWLEKTAIALAIGLVILVAALNIVATLVLLVMEKHKDIAILVSMGASSRSILALFMLQGTIIGAVGTACGAVLGFVACQVLDRYKLIQMPADVYQISYLPFKLLPLDAASVVVGAILISFLATIHPARNAARLDPAEALRYE